MADVLGGGGDGPEPAAKRAKVAVAGLPAEAAEFLRTETLHLAAASGVLLGADGPFAHAPLSLLPYPFPSSLFAQAAALAAPFNLLVDRISRDLEWLCGQVRSVVAHDAFTRRLLEVAETIKAEGAAQPLQLGIYRSDYMVHQPSEEATPRLLQVELNTISVSFVALGAKLTGLHRHLLPRCGAQGAAGAALRAQPALAAALADAERLPPNRSCAEIASAIAKAHAAYVAARAGKANWICSSPGGPVPGVPVVLMIVQPNERNVIDQRGLEHQLWAAHGVPLRRATLEEVQRQGKLDGDTKALRLGADEVSVAYFRAGYTPNDYPTETEWAARLLIERSFAIKCPSIGQHLAGTKKVQQVLAAPAMLARFVNPEQAAVLSSCFAGLHGLDEAGGAEVERAVSAALDSPEAYVLKPQREGGGNNLYGEEMATALAEMPAAERASYILMERISPPTHALPLMRNGVLDGGECIAELGIFGVFLGDGRQVLLNEQAGHLLRAKLAEVDEGGVCAGFAVLSSPVLFP